MIGKDHGRPSLVEPTSRPLLSRTTTHGDHHPRELAASEAGCGHLFLDDAELDDEGDDGGATDFGDCDEVRRR